MYLYGMRKECVRNSRIPYEYVGIRTFLHRCGHCIDSYIPTSYVHSYIDVRIPTYANGMRIFLTHSLHIPYAFLTELGI